MSDTTAQDCNCCDMERYCINGLCELCSDYNHELQAQRDALLELLKKWVKKMRLSVMYEPFVKECEQAIELAEKGKL